MCVIMICDEKRPNETMVAKAWVKNPDGGGAAWREGKGDKTEVVWEKGIMAEKGGLDRMQQLAAELPLPFILHFRIQTVGGIRPQLCHPFPVDKKASLALKGRTKGPVLFHNGTWKDWEIDTRQAAIHSNTPVPTGRWMDSRAMAWLCSIYGLGFMELLTEQRGVAFSPTGMNIYVGKGWTNVNDVYCSNDLFLNYVAPNNTHGNSNQSPRCKSHNCYRQDVDQKGWCPLHYQAITSGGTQGVSQASPSPFRPTTPGTIVSLDTALKLHEERDALGTRIVSKNLMKAIQKAYIRLGSPDEKEQLKARKSLEMVTLLPPFAGRLP